VARYYKTALFAEVENDNTYLLCSLNLNDDEIKERSRWFTRLTGVKAQPVFIEKWNKLSRQQTKYSRLVEYADRSWKIIDLE